MNSKRHVRRKQYGKRTQIFMIACVTAFCAILSCITLAYVFTKTDPVVNTFEGTTVGSEIIETFDGTTKSNVEVQNTGTVKSYIRANIIVTWAKTDVETDAEGNTVDSDVTVTAAVPQLGTDYTMTFEPDTAWVQGADGYWYYTEPVNAGESTATLIKECKLTTADAPYGYKLSVEILASAIQAEPADAVQTAWGVTVNSDGTLSVPVSTAG